jgi:hypothetical protein
MGKDSYQVVILKRKCFWPDFTMSEPTFFSFQEGVHLWLLVIDDVLAPEEDSLKHCKKLRPKAFRQN